MCRFGEVKVRILRMAIVNTKWLRLMEYAPPAIESILFVKCKGKSEARIDRRFSGQVQMLRKETGVKHEVACRPPIPVHESHYLAGSASLFQGEESRIGPRPRYIVLVERVIER